jgi:hypothetical protein
MRNYSWIVPLENARGWAMTSKKKTEGQRVLDRVRPAVITGIGLCLANYGMDLLMDRLGTNSSKTIANDVAIGVLGALAVYFFLSASRERDDFESAKERIILIRELNRRIREALGTIATSALSEERVARLQGIDEATDRIDDILTDLVSHPKSRNAREAVRSTKKWMAGQRS